MSSAPTYDELLARYAAARTELHAALCDGAFRIDRDPMALQGVFAALQAGAASTGQARTAVRRWLAGLPLPAWQHVLVQRVDGLDRCDVCGEATDPAAGCERHRARGAQ